MHPLVSFNGNILPDSAVSLPSISSAALYGRGVFTTLAVYRGQPFLWLWHETRLRENAFKLGLKVSETSLEGIQKSLLNLIERNQVKNGRARITLFDLRRGRIWRNTDESTDEPGVLIVTAERGAKAKKNLELTVSPFRVNSASPLTGIKSCNYLENVLALESAQKQNFDEAVRLNERSEVVSASMANLFWVAGDEIFTPALKTGALAGTTRQLVISLAQECGFVVHEKTVLLEDLQAADEIFLTSAGLGIGLVKNLDAKILKRKISAKIQTAFSKIINA